MIGIKRSWPALLLISGSVAMFLGVGVIWPYFEAAAAGLVDLTDYVQAVLG